MQDFIDETPLVFEPQDINEGNYIEHLERCLETYKNMLPINHKGEATKRVISASFEQIKEHEAKKP